MWLKRRGRCPCRVAGAPGAAGARGGRRFLALLAGAGGTIATAPAPSPRARAGARAAGGCEIGHCGCRGRRSRARGARTPRARARRSRGRRLRRQHPRPRPLRWRGLEAGANRTRKTTALYQIMFGCCPRRGPYTFRAAAPRFRAADCLGDCRTGQPRAVRTTSRSPTTSAPAATLTIVDQIPTSLPKLLDSALELAGPADFRMTGGEAPLVPAPATKGRNCRRCVPKGRRVLLSFSRGTAQS